MNRLKKYQRTKRKARLSREFSVNLGLIPIETIAGFPIKKGARNNLWNWNTLETIKL